MPDYVFVSTAVGIIGALVGLFSFLNGRQKDSNSQASFDSEVKTKLDFIGDDVKDIKAESRMFRNELGEVRETANRALSEAQKANERIDHMEEA